MTDLMDDMYYDGGHKWWESKEECNSDSTMNTCCNIVCIILILVIAYLVYKKWLCKRDGLTGEGQPLPPYQTNVLRMMVDGSPARDGQNYENRFMPQDERGGKQPRLYGNEPNHILADSLLAGN